ncbi:hypothetical protein KR200_004958 [Drosophila serrata]|nr:hypothetical protein KR200_004958 [Drosophila serrata]
MASNESLTQKLIGLYRSCECLWNPHSPGYLNGTAQEDAWRKITRGMNSGLTPDQVKLQVLALRSYYDAECAAIRQSKQEGYSYEPRHSYFNDLLFLGKVLSEETEESKASFCLSQLNGILEDSLIRKDFALSKYPQNFSEATFSQGTASLCKRSSDSKPDYTFYKLILEPEKPSTPPEMEKGEDIEKSRTASGNDNNRWYPTAYCVPCKRKKPGCMPRCPCTDSDSESSLEHCCARRAISVYGHKCCSCSSMCEHSQSSLCCCRPIVNNRGRCRYAEPGPKLCCQPRPFYVPKCHPTNTGRDKSCCVTNWRRNNKAVCRRLRAQLDAQEARNSPGCCNSTDRLRVQMAQHNSCCCDSHDCLTVQVVTPPSRCCESQELIQSQCAGQETRNTSYCCSERRQSGEDQMHACSQNGIPQITNYQSGCGSPCTNNNQQDLDYGRYNQQGLDTGNYCDNQQMPESNTYMSNQQVQQRYNNDPQGQQMYSNSMYYQMPSGKQNYYQSQQQCTQSTINSQQPTNLCSKQQYGNSNYVPLHPLFDYGRTSIPDQSNMFNCGAENPCGQLQTPAPVPVQRPLTCLPPQQDVQVCQAPCAASRTPELDNRYSVDTSRYTEQAPIIGGNVQQEDDDPRCCCVSKRDRQWQSDDLPRNNPTRRSNQIQGRYTDDELDTQRRRLNDCDQDIDQRQRVSRKVDRMDYVTRARSYDQMDHTSRSRGCYDESPNRRGCRNNGPERNYEEFPGGRKQSMAERDVCNTDCNYDKCPTLRRRRPDDCDDCSEAPTRRNPDIDCPRRLDQTTCPRKPSPEGRKKPKRNDYVDCKNPDCQPLKLPTKNCNGAQEPKACTLPTDDSQCVPCSCTPCPPYPPCRRVPRDYCMPADRCWYDREDRIAGKTRPPPRKCDYEDDRKPTTRNRCRPPPEEIECECESDNERIPCPHRRNSRNRDNRPTRPCDDKDDTCCLRPKNRQDQGKGKIEVCPACCTDNTCPYSSRRPPCRDPCASPKRKSRKCYDERELKNICRNQSASRKYPRPRDDNTDCDRPKKGCSSLQRPKKKTGPMDANDCECSSDDNNYDQGRCRICNRCCDDGPKENSKCRPRRTDRNESYKNNARSQRGYADIDDDYDCCEECCAKRCKKNLNDFLDGCACSSDSDEYNRKIDRSGCCGRRCESPRNAQKYKELGCKRPTNKTNSPCRQSKKTDVYESECDCQSNIPKRYDNKQSPRKQEYKSKGTDVYDSDYDCFCSYDEKKHRCDRKPPPCCPGPRCRNDQREQKIESTRCSRPEKRTCRKTLDTSQNKCTQNDATKDVLSEENQFEFCDCECKCPEDNATLKAKCDRVEEICACHCGPPFEPQLTQSSKRNPAGNGSPFDDKVGIEALKLDTANNQWQGAYKLNIDLPFSGETKLVQVPECNVSLPCKKKKPRPGSAGPSKNVRSLKLKSAAASPTRNSGPPKIQPGETAKKRTTSSSNGRRIAQGGARRTTDTSAAVNSKLLNDLNSASYFICKLQDDDNSQQYLIVVPKEPIARWDTRRDDPGQGSGKQLHCQRQFSGFQNVSWVNPASDSVLPSPPFHPIREISAISSFAIPPGMTETTMGIVKDYLQQTIIAGSSGLRRSTQSIVSPQTMLTTALVGPTSRCHSVDRPSDKGNAEIHTENPTVLPTNRNSIQNLSLAKDKEEVIVLLPPISGFRSSINSFRTDAVDVQRITVRNSGTDVNPTPHPTKPPPPKPPTKPKRNALL